MISPNLGLQETNTDAPQPGINNFMPKPPPLPGINNFMPPKPANADQSQPSGGFFGDYGKSKDVIPPPYVPPPPVGVPGLGGGTITPPNGGAAHLPGDGVRSLRGPGAVGAPPPAPFYATPVQPNEPAPTGMQYNDSKYNHPAPPPPVAGPPGGYGSLGNGMPPLPAPPTPRDNSAPVTNQNPGTAFLSDERSKAKIEPLDPELLKKYPGRGAVALGSEQMGNYAGVKEGDDMGLIPAQSAYYKQPIRPGVDLRAAQGFSYDYKDPKAPGAAEGRQVGPMAQHVEDTAAASTVHTDPKTGMKSIDTGRLALVNTAALAEEQKRTDRLEAMIAGMRAAPKPPGALPPPLPRPTFAPMDTSALDDAYARQSQVNPRY